MNILPKIAKARGKPWSTTGDRQEIFKEVLAMQSFRKHLSHPKLSNWFAWNKAVKEQIREFHAGKMIYESQLTTETDPDASGSFKIGVNVSPHQF